MKIQHYARVLAMILVMTILITGFGSIANNTNSTSLHANSYSEEMQEPLSNETARRVVMIESFTNTDCAPCAPANPMMNDLVNEYGPTQVSIVRYHVWWPDVNDPFHQANIDENTDRTNYYGVSGVPDCVYDGVIHDGDRDEYRNHIDERLQVPSPLKIRVTGTLGDTEGSITANITAVDEITQVELKAHFLVTEDNVPYNAPNGETKHRFAMRDMIPNAWGDNITISEGESIEMTKTFIIDGDWNRSSLWAIVFVQSNSTKEILQSGNYYFRGIWPDLVISDEDVAFSDPTPNEGDTITVTTTVHNVGNENATNVIVRFYDGRPNTIGATQVGTDQIITNILANGGSEDASIQWDTTGERGEHNIFVRADATFEIMEPNEENNTAGKNIHVAPPNDVGVDSVEPFVEDETYSMNNYTTTANVTNYGANSQSPFDVTCEIKKLGALEQRTLFSDDFDGADKGWIEDPTSGCWERGSPTSGPGNAHSTPNVWATNLAGNYPGNANDWLISPIIKLPSRASSINLTFWHWYSFDTGAGISYDYGYVKITQNNGLNWNELSSYTSANGAWEKVVINVSSYKGNEVRIAFQMWENEGFTVSSGWYIDDFEIIGTLPNETTVYGPDIKSTVGTMNQDDVQQITWNYEFTSEGNYTLITNTSLSGDQYTNNDWKNITFTISGEGEQTFEIELASGLNLISLPLLVKDPTPTEPSQGPYFSAQDLINSINADAGSSVAVYKWDGAWYSFYDGDPASLDFEIKVWEGYFVKCTSSSTWMVKGTLIPSESVPLSTGLNLIGASQNLSLDDPTPSEPPQGPYYSAQDLINSINADGGSAVAVYKWDGAWYSFYDGDPASLDFAIERGAGYFVKCTSASDWTP